MNNKDLEARLAAKREELEQRLREDMYEQVTRLYEETIEQIPGVILLSFDAPKVRWMGTSDDSLLTSLYPYHTDLKRYYTDKELIEWYTTFLKKYKFSGETLIDFNIRHEWPEKYSRPFSWVRVVLDTNYEWVEHVYRIDKNFGITKIGKDEQIRFWEDEFRYEVHYSEPRLEKRRAQLKRRQHIKFYRETIESIPGMTFMELVEPNFQDSDFTAQTILANLPYYNQAAKRRTTDDEIIEMYTNILKQRHISGETFVRVAFPGDEHFPHTPTECMKVLLDATYEWVADLHELTLGVGFTIYDQGERLRFFNHSKRNQYEVELSSANHEQAENE